MSATQAKRIIENELISRKLAYTKLTARTIGFSDLARGNKLFVKIHGWQPNPQWDELKTVARKYAFCIE